MFPSLNETIGWGRGIESILPNSTILLGDSNPIDSLPFIYTFMNFWLKSSVSTPLNPSNQTATAIILVSFKTAQNRVSNVFRKLYGIQLNLMAAQSKFAFVDAVNTDADNLISEIEAALKKTEKSRTLIILEGFAWTLASGMGSVSSFTKLFTKIESFMQNYNANLLIQWSRDLESDYPGRNPLLIEDVRLGGAGWSLLLASAHYVFCVRPLKSGMSRDANGEIVAALGPAMQAVEAKPVFHPIITLFRIPTDNTIQCFTKGNNNNL